MSCHTILSYANWSFPILKTCITFQMSNSYFDHEYPFLAKCAMVSLYALFITSISTVYSTTYISLHYITWINQQYTWLAFKAPPIRQNPSNSFWDIPTKHKAQYDAVDMLDLIGRDIQYSTVVNFERGCFHNLWIFQFSRLSYSTNKVGW